MLYVLFQLGKDRYALEAKRVVEIVPLMTMQTIPQAPKGVSGLMVYRGRAIPVVDLSEMTQGQAARERMSTRIIIVNYSDGPEKAEMLKAESRNQFSAFAKSFGATFSQTAPQRSGGGQLSAFPPLLGLIAERATEMLRRNTPSTPSASTRFDESRQSEAAADAEVECSPSQLEELGPVLLDERGVIQLLQPQKLLDEKVRELLGRIWPVAEAGSEEGHKTVTVAK